MAISTENALSGVIAADEPRRAGRELVLELAFAPVANALVPVLLALRTHPLVVVGANLVFGLLAAAAVAGDELLLAAGLLQLKTLCDNLDGRVARASGRVTLTGRYLDTEADYVVTAALFAALAHVAEAPWLALAAFCALAFVLTVDFKVSELHRVAHGRPSPQPPATGGIPERIVERVYRVLLGPLDRLVEWVSARRLERLLVPVRDPRTRERATLAYYDTFTVTVLANLGLSTQLAALAAVLVLDLPSVYLWLVLAAAAALPFLQRRREGRVRRALRS